MVDHRDLMPAADPDVIRVGLDAMDAVASLAGSPGFTANPANSRLVQSTWELALSGADVSVSITGNGVEPPAGFEDQPMVWADVDAVDAQNRRGRYIVGSWWGGAGTVLLSTPEPNPDSHDEINETKLLEVLGLSHPREVVGLMRDAFKTAKRLSTLRSFVVGGLVSGSSLRFDERQASGHGSLHTARSLSLVDAGAQPFYFGVTLSAAGTGDFGVHSATYLERPANGLAIGVAGMLPQAATEVLTVERLNRVERRAAYFLALAGRR